MVSHLDRIESRLKTLVESSMQVLPGGSRQQLLAHQLSEAVQDSLELAADGAMTASVSFFIYLSPASLALWQSVPGLCDSLAAAIQEALSEGGVTLRALPAVQLQPDPVLQDDELRVLPVELAGATAATAVMPSLNSQPNPAAPDPRPLNAFLIVDGSRTIPLRQVVINIGRRPDNHLVIDDPRVSRTHAQLRAVRGRYLVFDLNSTGGTFVNGARISQTTLKPGDVISLAGIPVIYGEDNTGIDTGPKESTADLARKKHGEDTRPKKS